MALLRIFNLLIACFFIVMSPLGNCNPADSFGFNATRVVFNENNNKGVLVHFFNSTDNDYLLRLSILRSDSKGQKVDGRLAPFVVNPPLSRVPQNSEKIFNILRTGRDIPDDRESLFYISATIAPQKGMEPSSVGIGYIWNMKLFYRPDLLKNITVSKSLNSLSINRDGEHVYIKNSSPVWFTLVNIKINGRDESKSDVLMVGPFGSSFISAPKNKGVISFSVIDESGHRIPDNGLVFKF